MKKNKKGFIFLYSLMIGILCFFLGMALSPTLKDTAAEAMGSSQLDCSNISISNQDKAVCTQIDFFLPLFLGLLFGLAGFLISGVAL